MDATFWAAVGSVAAVLATGIAAIAAHQANSAAKAMRDIEQQRHHHELAPQFSIMCAANDPYTKAQPSGENP